MSAERMQGMTRLFLIGIISLIAVSVILLMGTAILASSTDSLANDDPVNKSSNPDPVTGEWVSYDNGIGAARVLEVYEVNDSTGYAVRFSGADDSYMQSDQNIEISTDQDFTVATWASVNSSSSGENMTAISANGRVMIQYNGSDGNWSAYYFDEANRNSYRLELNAPNQPGNLTWLAVIVNGTHMEFTRNNTANATVQLSTTGGDQIANASLNTQNWHGRIDETRLFDESLNESQRNNVFSEPVAPRPGAVRTGRVMYDEGEGTTTAIYFTSTSATLSNITWVQTGLDGHVLTEGTDYQMDPERARIRALAGGRIDGAPVVWIEYRYQPSDLANISRGIQIALSLFATSIVVIPAVIIIGLIVVGLIGALKVSGDTFGRSGRRR